MARGQALPEDVRAEVAGALLGGLGIRAAARQYRLPISTVAGIKAALGDRVPVETPAARDCLDNLLVAAMQRNLEAQARICEVVSEPEYIRRQPAGEVAELYQTLADHSVRLLEAAASTEAEDAP